MATDGPYIVLNMRYPYRKHGKRRASDQRTACGRRLKHYQGEGYFDHWWEYIDCEQCLRVLGRQ